MEWNKNVDVNQLFGIIPLANVWNILVIGSKLTASNISKVYKFTLSGHVAFPFLKR